MLLQILIELMFSGRQIPGILRGRSSPIGDRIAIADDTVILIPGRSPDAQLKSLPEKSVTRSTFVAA